MTSSPGEIVLTVIFSPRPGAGESLMRALERLGRASRRDTGCLAYDFHGGKDGRILLLERWATRELLELHQNQPFLQQFQETAGPLLASPPELLEWKPLDLKNAPTEAP
ncbi:Quinol monooxygenase YgiN [Paucidesulfovibrio gracilis DSM 16080]|jgi:quinol monooxygenase YgiN|uniref:Quinol monooxygenase YgiN n=1 Tax=Paucidesulfovibrio gracilis DSM 16080 TaxID=1121449 RepID=A0A1T4XSR7_9BACT|nr:putative quinol monooxygenase [Paucidesulfovibrio gracilis]SKA92188.1 Quinol monooxygenase YgiN [Paucidesulfovibrio gracilis DSM 16080]